MSPTIIMILLLAVGVLGGMIKAYSAGEARCEANHLAAQKAEDDRVAAITKKLQDEAVNHIADMDAAYTAGEEKGKADQAAREKKGASDVQRYAVFSNPVCTLPAESLQNLNDARAAVSGGVQPDAGGGKADVPAAPDPGQVHGPVPAAGKATAGQPGNPVPAGGEGHRPLGAVHP